MKLFDHPKLNARQGIWLAFISEFDFEINYIKGKENKVANAFNRRMQVVHVAFVSTCEFDIKGNINEVA